MGHSMGITRKELSALLGVSVATIRAWDSRFQWEGKTPPQPPHDNTPKEYNDNDMAVFTIIARGRAAGRSLDDIANTLDNELVTFTDDQLPEPPEQPITDDKEAPGQLVPLSQFINLQRAFERASGQLEATEGERDRLLDDLAKEREARIEAEKEAANLAGQLTAKAQAPWYRRLFGRD